LASAGFRFFTDHIRKQLDIDYAYGIGHDVDDDARTLVGDVITDDLGSHDIDGVLSHLTLKEGVDREDVTVITDQGCVETPGIRLHFDLGVLLDCYNKHAMSKENLLGLLGSFGIPQLN
jgi:hypothetical protein